MTLYDLGEQYSRQSQNIRQEIRRRRKNLPNAQGEELIEERRRIAQMYSIAADCAKIGNKLMHYYDET